jgi:hypothetical protein
VGSHLLYAGLGHKAGIVGTEAEPFKVSVRNRQGVDASQSYVRRLGLAATSGEAKLTHE